MAEAGFYYVGSSSEPDLARCYYCRRELDGWEPTDVPWDEHKRRECPFINLGKSPMDLTVEDAFTLEAERKCIIVVISVRKCRKEWFFINFSTLERSWQGRRGTVQKLFPRAKIQN